MRSTKKTIFLQQIIYIFNERIILIQQIIYIFNEIIILIERIVYVFNGQTIFIQQIICIFKHLFMYSNGKLKIFYMFNDSEIFFPGFKIQG